LLSAAESAILYSVVVPVLFVSFDADLEAGKSFYPQLEMRWYDDPFGAFSTKSYKNTSISFV
jgi:hypothetical protein